WMFFFSSRRRHTRFDCDWSSDVCSSDLAKLVRPRIQQFRQPGDTRSAWAKEFLRQQFRSEFGGDHPPDWQVHTSFLPDVQDAARSEERRVGRERGSGELAVDGVGCKGSV